jgi:hypothetical protein
MANARLLPDVFNIQVFRNLTAGVLASILGVVALAVAFRLDLIASAASVAFLIAYIGVHLAAWKLAPEIGASRVIVGLGIVTMTAVLAVFLYQLWGTQPGAVWMSAALVVGSILVQAALAAF